MAFAALLTDATKKSFLNCSVKHDIPQSADKLIKFCIKLGADSWNLALDCTLCNVLEAGKVFSDGLLSLKPEN